MKDPVRYAQALYFYPGPRVDRRVQILLLVLAILVVCVFGIPMARYLWVTADECVPPNKSQLFAQDRGTMVAPARCWMELP